MAFLGNFNTGSCAPNDYSYSDDLYGTQAKSHCEHVTPTVCEDWEAFDNFHHMRGGRLDSKLFSVSITGISCQPQVMTARATVFSQL